MKERFQTAQCSHCYEFQQVRMDYNPRYSHCQKCHQPMLVGADATWVEFLLAGLWGFVLIQIAPHSMGSQLLTHFPAFGAAWVIIRINHHHNLKTAMDPSFAVGAFLIGALISLACALPLVFVWEAVSKLLK